MDKDKKEELETTEGQMEINTEEVVSNNILEEQNEDKIAVDSDVSVVESHEKDSQPGIDEEKELTKEFDIIQLESILMEDEKTVKKKKKIIIISAILGLIVISIILFFVFLEGKDKIEDSENQQTKEPEVVTPDLLSDEECQKIMKNYGDELAIYIIDYIEQGYNLDAIKVDALTNILDGYEVKCNTFEIEEDGSLFLDECSINGSDSLYSYEFINEDDEEDEYYSYEIHSKDGVITFCYDGSGAYDIEEVEDEETECEEKYTIECEEESCILTKSAYKYALVEEKSGKKTIYEYGKKNSKIYTLTDDDVVVTFMLREYFVSDSDAYEEEVFALLLKNKSNDEALYSIKDKKIVFNYGKYKYDWEGEYFSEYPVIEQLIKVYSNKKVGFVDVNNYSVVVEPKEYDTLSNSGNYIYTTIGEYTGLLYYDYTNNQLSQLLVADTYDNVIVKDNFIYVVKNNKMGVYDKECKSLLLNGKFYKAAIMVDYNGGQALVLDGDIFKLLDKDGNLIKSLGKIASGAELAYDFYTHGFGSYYDEEEKETSVYFKFTNPKLEEYLAKQEACEKKCESIEDEEDIDICIDDCWNESGSVNDCLEYYYTFETGKLTKKELECYAYAKPVLYLYPTLPTFITVTFDKPENLTTTYPKYNNGWKVLASPTGDLYDLENKYYYALYWEEDSNHTVDFNEGFYVTKNNAIEFLEEKLDKIGFTARERNEFIMYWLPILEKNEKSLVYFELTEERDSYSKININPKPDSLLRVAIHIKKVDSYTKIKEQKLPTFKREGFTAVEWGGVTY